MVYAVLPRRQEPQLVSDGVYNCSVAHFEAFAPVLRCNMLVECTGGEDERDCGTHTYSDRCKQGMINVGTKCYRFPHPVDLTAFSWRDASAACFARNETLVTLTTKEERIAFRKVAINFVNIYVGAIYYYRDKELSPILALTYKSVWQWLDGRTAFNIFVSHAYSIIDDNTREINVCAFYFPRYDNFGTNVCHEKMHSIQFACESASLNYQSSTQEKIKVKTLVTDDAVWNMTVVKCQGGHVVHDFLSCDLESQCGVNNHRTSCKTEVTEVPMFWCEQSAASVHYTLVCDHVQHCPDNADEDFCRFPPCPSGQCQNQQCISFHKFCDGTPDCLDLSDENCFVERYRSLIPKSANYPWMVNMDGKGQYTLIQLNNVTDCNDTHFLCPEGACLPVFLRCNDVDDCAGREDEAECETYTCPGFYRCRGSKICLHPDHMCDGLWQCPQQDDERFCDFRCPDVCRCQGLAFVCPQEFNLSSQAYPRFLDASRSGMTLSDITVNHFLVHLKLSRCRIVVLEITALPNLRHLDLSVNQLITINMDSLTSLENLRVLDVSNNPLIQIINTQEKSAHKMGLQTVDMSFTSIVQHNSSAFSNCPDLRTINMSWSHLISIGDKGFKSTPRLETLDTRGSPLMLFTRDVLRDLKALKSVYTDNFKLCCQAILPADFEFKNCHAKEDLLASCEDLLKSNTYRIFLWVFAAFTIVGNAATFVAMVYLGSSGMGGFGVFVANLCVADLFMGVYLAIIGTADFIYSGQYIFHDITWKNSMACRAAGFLSVLSSEVSALNICLGTLDRFLKLCFPFSKIHFSRRSSIVACCIIWTVGIVLATIPLLPMTSHWQFFSQTGICIPLPFTSSEYFLGHVYHFSVMIVLNFSLSILIAIGQVAIYWSVRVNSLSSRQNATAKDARVALRWVTVALSDFLCWFTIGLLGVLASSGAHISDDLNVFIATFVLPFNSTLNPFLYNLNGLLERRRKLQKENLTAKLKLNMNVNRRPITADCHNKSQSRAYTPPEPLADLHRWLEDGTVTPDNVTSCLRHCFRDTLAQLFKATGENIVLLMEETTSYLRHTVPDVKRQEMLRKVSDILASEKTAEQRSLSTRRST